MTKSKANSLADTKKKTVTLYEKLLKNPHTSICEIQDISTFSNGDSITVVEESLLKWHSLKQIWRKQGNEFREREVGLLAFQVLQALRHLHDMGVVHGRINLGNILCNKRDLRSLNDLQFKIGNFEGARLLSKDIQKRD